MPPSSTRTFLLTDIEGSTRLWERDADAMAIALDRHDEIIGSIVSATGGQLIKSKGEGDATFSVFDDAAAAVAAAMTVQSRLSDEAWPADLVVRVRMSVHTGEAMARRGDYFGPTVNRAARLRSLASGGQVFLSHATAELVGASLPPDTTLIPLGPHVLKDLAEPEDVFALVGGAIAAPAQSVVANDALRGFEALPMALRGATSTVFVGREAEMAQLSAAFGSARNGRTTLVFVGGEPGIGKTTVVSQLARKVADDAVVLFGRCDENLGAPYQPFAEAIDAYLAAAPPDLFRRQAGPGARELVRLVPRLLDTLPDLELPTATDAETERFRLFKATADLFATMCASRPVVLVLDDVQWATQPTLMLLREVVRRSDLRLLVIATFRDTELDRKQPLWQALADFWREPNVERISVRGLEPDEVHSYLRAAAGNARLDARSHELAKALWSETHGNPFFLGEVIAHLIESNTLYEHNGVWQADANLVVSELALPESVRDVIRRRLDRLDEATNKVLSVGSVIGPTFRARVVEVVVDLDEDAVLDALDAACDAGLLHDDGKRFTFAHALIRHALYDDLSTTRRTRLHRRIGEALESLGPAASDGHHARALAHHYQHAAADGAIEKALEYALVAGRDATSHGALEDAVTILQRGVALASEADPVHVACRMELNIAICEAHRRRGAMEEIVAAGEAAIADARVLDDPVQFARAVTAGSFGAVGIPAERSVALVQEALGLLGDDHDELRVALIADHAIALAGSYGRRDEALVLARRAAELADRTGDAFAMCRAIDAQLLVLLASPDIEERIRLIDRRLPLLESIAHEYALPQAWDDRSQVALALGDFEQHERALEGSNLVQIDWEPVTLALLSGDFGLAADNLVTPFGNGPNYFNVWAAQLYQLHRDRGTMAEFLPLFEAAGAESPLIAAFRAALALALAEQGRTTDAHRELDDLLAAGLDHLPHDSLWPATLILAGETAAVVGDTQASALYDALSPWSGQVVLIPHTVLVLGPADRVLGMLAAQLGMPGQAAEHFARATDLARSLQSPPWIARSLLAEAQWRLSRNEFDEADERATEARLIATSVGMPIVAAQARSMQNESVTP